VSVIFDSFLIETWLLRFADDVTVVTLYNADSVVLPRCQLLTDDDRSVRLTTGVVCPASVKNVLYK